MTALAVREPWHQHPIALGVHDAQMADLLDLDRAGVTSVTRFACTISGALAAMLVNDAVGRVVGERQSDTYIPPEARALGLTSTDPHAVERLLVEVYAPMRAALLDTDRPTEGAP